MTQIEQILTDAGIRPTAIRILVLRKIIEYNKVFTLSEMEDKLESLDKSTLFRTLTLFLSHKLLHEVDNGSNSKLYCLCLCQSKNNHVSHLHFTCNICHETFCIKDIDISKLPYPENFEVTEINFVMKGLCPKCKHKTQA